MKKLYSHVEWKRANPNPHFVFQTFYLSCINVDPDELHIMHLGTSMYLLGSVLWLLCFDILTGTPVQNMGKVWHHIVEEYKRPPATVCQYSNLTLKSFCNPDKWDTGYPKLKGKGAEVKDLVVPLYKVWLTQL